MRFAVQLVAIVVCGFVGAVAGWAATRALEWQGTVAALAAAVIGMLIATLVWTAGVAIHGVVASRRIIDDPGCHGHERD